MTWNATLDLMMRRLEAVRDPSRIATAEPLVLDDRTQALARIGAAVCEGASRSTFASLVTAALDEGATEEEVLGALLCVAALAGESRIVAATPGISNALGYDLDEAFEHG